MVLWWLYITSIYCTSVVYCNPCLPKCSCDKVGKKNRVNCTGKYDGTFPSGIPKNTHILDLSYNGLTSVPQNAFEGMNLTKFDIRGNKIRCTCEYITTIENIKKRSTMQEEPLADCLFNGVSIDVLSATSEVTGPPPYIQPLPEVYDIQSTNFKIKLVEFNDTCGSLTKYDVVVAELGNSSYYRRNYTNYTKHEIAIHIDGLYIAANIINSSMFGKEFTVGDNISKGGEAPQNKALKPSTYYGVFVRGYITDLRYQTTEWYNPVKTKPKEEVEKGLDPAITAVITILIILLIIVAIAAWKTKAMSKAVKVALEDPLLADGQKHRDNTRKPNVVDDDVDVSFHDPTSVHQVEIESTPEHTPHSRVNGNVS